MAQVVEDPIAAAREAAQPARLEGGVRPPLDAPTRWLDADDVELLADAAFWSVRLDESLALRERAYKAFLDEGNNVHAGGIAIRLALDYLGSGTCPLQRLAGARRAPARRWARSRGSTGRRRSSARSPRCWAGNLDEEARAGGARLRDRQALRQPRSPGSLARQQGSALVYLGELDRGLALLDEASTSALIGELDPVRQRSSTACISRNSQGVGDFERAASGPGPPTSGATSRTRTAFREPAASTARRSSGSAASGRR